LKLPNDYLLLIFTRNPELGKCKTRLAATTGDETALEIYKFLLRHTVAITYKLEVHKRVYYADAIWDSDYWDASTYEKMLQAGSNLGERMRNAFDRGFKDGYSAIVVIGCDLLDFTQNDLEEAFTKLEVADYVIGPAYDGGYYLLGMHSPTPHLFADKSWGTQTVLGDTLSDLTGRDVALLPVRNDIDTWEDIKDDTEFNQFIK
jgi:rSAM/selenodomain-associated transferase 1